MRGKTDRLQPQTTRIAWSVLPFGAAKAGSVVTRWQSCLSSLCARR